MFNLKLSLKLLIVVVMQQHFRFVFSNVQDFGNFELAPMYSKTCVNWLLSKRLKFGFQDHLVLNAGHKHAECSKWSILQYFRPSLSYQLLLRSLFCLL